MLIWGWERVGSSISLHPGPGALVPGRGGGVGRGAGPPASPDPWEGGPRLLGNACYQPCPTPLALVVPLSHLTPRRIFIFFIRKLASVDRFGIQNRFPPG